MNKIFKKLAIFFANKSGGIVIFGNKNLLLQLKYPLEIQRVNVVSDLAKNRIKVEIETDFRYADLNRYCD